MNNAQVKKRKPGTHRFDPANAVWVAIDGVNRHYIPAAELAPYVVRNPRADMERKLAAEREAVRAHAAAQAPDEFTARKRALRRHFRGWPLSRIDVRACRAMRLRAMRSFLTSSLHSTAYVEVGTTGGTSNAPANQIPQLTGPS